MLTAKETLDIRRRLAIDFTMEDLKAHQKEWLDRLK
jgi:hypothetical protein